MHPPDPALSRHLLLLLAVLLLVGPSASPAADGKPAPTPPASTALVPDPAAETAGSQLSAFGRQIPAQRPNRGIWIPSFSSGARNSLIEADVVTRIDDYRLIAENMTLHLYGKEPKDHVTVALPIATYHMTQQILRSSERSKVSRADFDLEGDSLIFDTTTSQGRMTGNVRMTIHDAGSFMKSAQSQAKPQSQSQTQAQGSAESAAKSPTAPQTPTAAPSKPGTPAKTQP